MSKEQGKLNPLFIIVVAVIILTLFVRYSFEDSTLLSAGSLSYPTVKTYMGIFFIVFSLLKLCDLDKFAEMFRSYDFMQRNFTHTHGYTLLQSLGLVFLTYLIMRLLPLTF